LQTDKAVLLDNLLETARKESPDRYVQPLKTTS